MLLLSPFLQQELERVFSYERYELRRSSRTARSLNTSAIFEQKTFQRLFSPVPLLVSCLATLMTTQSSTPQSWDAPMLSARSTGISFIRWSATTVVIAAC